MPEILSAASGARARAMGCHRRERPGVIGFPSGRQQRTTAAFAAPFLAGAKVGLRLFIVEAAQFAGAFDFAFELLGLGLVLESGDVEVALGIAADKGLHAGVGFFNGGDRTGLAGDALGQILTGDIDEFAFRRPS